MNDQRKELLGFFFAEVTEHLEMLEQEIIRLEKDTEDKEIIQNIFRYAHSIKGSSASMGFEHLKALTHQMEYVLDLIRKEKLDATRHVVDVLFECLDALRVLKDEYENENDPSDISDIVQKLKELTTSEQPKQATGVKTIQVAQNEAVQKALEAGKPVALFHVLFHETSQARTIRAHLVKKEIEKIGTLLHMDVTQIDDPAIRTASYYVIKEQENESEVMTKIQHIMDIEGVQSETLKAEEKPKKAPVAKHPKKASNQTVRVDVHKIEDLMNLVGEILIDQTMVSQINQELKGAFQSNEAVSEQERILKHMSRVISEFQENVMKIRMLPIEQLFSRFPRVVRDLSGQLGKEIELVMEGGETELDRTVIEELSDPMIHIIRNSLDHGIESADVRKAAGKPEKGTVTISATHKENQVVLVVEDDGAGIDPEKIKHSALKKGVITPQQAEKMTDNELIHLVFAAGFSTAQTVSDVSGRGVGMDVVRNHIEKLNGMVEIESKKGVGTKMVIKLPLTLAILKAFLIEISKRTFAIPMSSVIEIFRIKKESIQSVNGQKMVKIRDLSIPLYFGHDMFGFNEAQEEQEELVMMLIGIAEKRIGLIVDRLTGNQEIVIKSLGSYVGKIPAISGSTILGDGKVALILDVAGIFKLFSERKDESTP